MGVVAEGISVAAGDVEHDRVEEPAQRQTLPAAPAVRRRRRVRRQVEERHADEPRPAHALYYGVQFINERIGGWMRSGAGRQAGRQGRHLELVHMVSKLVERRGSETPSASPVVGLVDSVGTRLPTSMRCLVRTVDAMRASGSGGAPGSL